MWDYVLVGAIISVLSQYHEDLWALLTSHICTTITMASSDEAFRWFTYWLSSSPHCQYREVSWHKGELRVPHLLPFLDGVKMWCVCVCVTRCRGVRTSRPTCSVDRIPSLAGTPGQLRACG